MVEHRVVFGLHRSAGQLIDFRWSWLTRTAPDAMLDRMRLRENLLAEARGPLKLLVLNALIGDRDAPGIIRPLRERTRKALIIPDDDPNWMPQK